jgi:polyhydroxyalkanoate synthesis regulator phasin
MAAKQPMWRRMFDAAERPVGRTLERLVQTEGFADVVARAKKAQVQSRRRVERVTRHALHLWNLPAATDVKRVEERLAAVERRLRDVSKRLEQSEGER